ncbi:hypothetical protein RBY4I_903 [Rhodobacterales bacterium Y4I]|nr:hypothetical protein RBY4I_903 [Rhodobacterales bacterium Y4I]
MGLISSSRQLIIFSVKSADSFAKQNIVTYSTDKCVITSPTYQKIVTTLTFENVVPTVSTQLIIAAPTEDLISLCIRGNHVY